MRGAHEIYVGSFNVKRTVFETERLGKREIFLRSSVVVGRDGLPIFL